MGVKGAPFPDATVAAPHRPGMLSEESGKGEQEAVIVRNALVYRLYPTRAQATALDTIVWRTRERYNAGLEERRAAYRTAKVSISGRSQQAQLPGITAIRPEYAELDAQMLQDVLERLDRAFAGFFRRINAGRTPGYPRFRGPDRYDSFTFKQTGWKLNGGRLVVRRIGARTVTWSRPIQGAIKTVTIRRDAGSWFVSCCCLIELADPTPDPALPAVGIDLGLAHFATLSAGTHVATPRHLRLGQAVLTRRRQTLDRQQVRSRRRTKARRLVATAQRTIRNQRKDHHHTTARDLVRTHGLIAVEALRIATLVRRPAPLLGVTADEGSEVYLPNGAATKAGRNKSIHDAGWRQFLAILGSKAEEAGCVMIVVNPAGTSQTCSGCGALVPTPLSERWHTGTQCGCSLHRDVNAARNIRARAGQALQADRA
jgi:putative transposase